MALYYLVYEKHFINQTAQFSIALLSNRKVIGKVGDGFQTVVVMARYQGQNEKLRFTLRYELNIICSLSLNSANLRLNCE